MNAIPAILGVSAVVALAGAQSATLTLSHDDADGLVTPGQIVTVSATVQWDGPPNAYWFWMIRGGVNATDDRGVASNNRFGHPDPVINQAATVLNVGSPRGGSIEGVDIFTAMSYGPFQQFAWPWFKADGLVILEYDWMAPIQPGAVDFDWAPHPTLPDVWLVPHFPPGLAAQSTYIGTSLTVIPAPAAIVPIVASVLAGCRRRRAPDR